MHNKSIPEHKWEGYTPILEQWLFLRREGQSMREVSGKGISAVSHNVFEKKKVMVTLYYILSNNIPALKVICN